VVTINKNSANYITVTVTEYTTIVDARYLFEAKNKESKVYNYCLLGSDLSNHDHFNEFIVTEKALPSQSASQIELSVGQYIYTIYELTAAQASALNFNSIDTTIYTVVEGPCQARCIGDVTTNEIYQKTVTNDIYEG